MALPPLTPPLSRLPAPSSPRISVAAPSRPITRKTSLLSQHQDLLTLLALRGVTADEAREIAAASSSSMQDTIESARMRYEVTVYVAGDEGSDSDGDGSYEAPFATIASAVAAISPATQTQSGHERIRTVRVMRQQDYSTEGNLTIPAGRWVFSAPCGAILPSLTWEISEAAKAGSTYDHLLVVRCDDAQTLSPLRSDNLGHHAVRVASISVAQETGETAPTGFSVVMRGMNLTSSITVASNLSSGPVPTGWIRTVGSTLSSVVASTCALVGAESYLRNVNVYASFGGRDCVLNGTWVYASAPTTTATRAEQAWAGCDCSGLTSVTGPAGCLVVDALTDATVGVVTYAGAATKVVVGADAQPGRFFDETATATIYVSTSGSDSTGDGLTAGTAYASVERALRDLPALWTADVDISVAAGTYAGNKTWVIPPAGAKTTATGFGKVSITGAVTEVALTGGGAGVAVAGTLSQFNYTFDPFVAVVTDGSHFIHADPSNGLYVGAPVLSSTSPTLKVVNASSGAFTNPRLAQWAVTFSGTVRVESPTSTNSNGHHVSLNALSFAAAVSGTGWWARCCKFATSQTLNDCSLVQCTMVTGTTTWNGTRPSLCSMTSNVWISGTCSVAGSVLGFSSCTWMGAASTPAKLALGGTSGTITSGLTPAFVRQLALCDFRGTGTAVRQIGGVLHSGGTSAGCTVVITGGAALVATDGARIYGGVTWSWTGTADTASSLSEQACLITSGGFAVSAGGNDLTVGSTAVQAVTTRPTTDATQLCRYT